MLLLLFRSDFLFNGRPLGPLPRPGIGLGSLPVNRQRSPMPEPSVATKIHKPLDIHGDLGPQLALNLVLLINRFTDLVDFSISQIVCLCVRIYVQRIEDLFRRSPTDTVDIGQSDLDPFSIR